MYRTQGVLALLALYLGWAHCFSWDVVVGVNKQLGFYDSDGTRTYTEDTPANVITSLAYDPVHNCVLFADYSSSKYSIFSYNIATRKIIILVSGASEDYLNIAYDPITSLLFWTERSGKYSIYSKGYSIAGDKNLFIKLDGPYETIWCITVDSSRGYIYWSTNRKIERARLDGSERQVVIDKEVGYLRGIAIDQQTQKMYWIDNEYDAGAYQITIESADLNGENRKTLSNEHNTFGGALVVSKDFIYWRTETTISQLTRNPPHDKEVKAKQFLLAKSSFIMAMASNYKIEDQTQGTQNCESLKKLLPFKSEINDCASLNVSTDVSLLCVHGTKVSGECRCECTQGYIGERCEVSVCHNYCFQGDCSVSAEGQPQCRCKPGYSGERCEVNACHEYCSNNGVCVLNEESEPVCQCTGGYEGERCNVSVCQNYCFQGDCSVSAEGQPKCRCNAGYSGDRCEVNANNTLKGSRIDMDYALVNFTDDIKDTLRGLREEIGMSKLNDSTKCTLSDMKQEMNTLRSELDKLKESVRTVAHDVSELKSSAQFQAAEQNELKGCVDTTARHSSDQSQILVNTQVQVFTSSQKGAMKT